jgi:uncharacterized membrane protein
MEDAEALRVSKDEEKKRRAAEKVEKARQVEERKKIKAQNRKVKLQEQAQKQEAKKQKQFTKEANEQLQEDFKAAVITKTLIRQPTKEIVYGVEDDTDMEEAGVLLVRSRRARAIKAPQRFLD